MNSDGPVLLLLIAAIALCYYFAFSNIESNRDKYKQLCAKHKLEYVDWNTNAVSCFDPKTNVVKAFKYES